MLPGNQARRNIFDRTHHCTVTVRIRSQWPLLRQWDLQEQGPIHWCTPPELPPEAQPVLPAPRPSGDQIPTLLFAEAPSALMPPQPNRLRHARSLPSEVSLRPRSRRCRRHCYPRSAVDLSPSEVLADQDKEHGEDSCSHRPRQLSRWRSGSGVEDCLAAAILASAKAASAASHPPGRGSSPSCGERDRVAADLPATNCRAGRRGQIRPACPTFTDRPPSPLHAGCRNYRVTRLPGSAGGPPTLSDPMGSAMTSTGDREFLSLTSWRKARTDPSKSPGQPGRGPPPSHSLSDPDRPTHSNSTILYLGFRAISRPPLSGQTLGGPVVSRSRPHSGRSGFVQHFDTEPP